MGGQALPLGISPRLISDPPINVELRPGDLLVLATDGFFEWANAQKEQFGAAKDGGSDSRLEASAPEGDHLDGLSSCR